MSSWRIKSESKILCPFMVWLESDVRDEVWLMIWCLCRWLDLTDKENPEFIYSL